MCEKVKNSICRPRSTQDPDENIDHTYRCKEEVMDHAQIPQCPMPSERNGFSVAKSPVSCRSLWTTARAPSTAGWTDGKREWRWHPDVTEGVSYLLDTDISLISVIQEHWPAEDELFKNVRPQLHAYKTKNTMQYYVRLYFHHTHLCWYNALCFLLPNHMPMSSKIVVEY